MFEDPNWLMSSTAQAAAAVVAIVAGFITTRVLGLSSERRAMANLLAQRRGSMTFLTKRRAEIISRRQDIQVYEAFQTVRTALEEGNDPSLEWAIGETSGWGIPAERVRVEHERLTLQRNMSRQFVEDHQETIRPTEDVERWVRRKGADIEGLGWPFLVRFYQDKQSEIQRTRGGLWLGALATGGPFYAPTLDPQVELRLENGRVDSDIAALQAEMDGLTASLGSLVMPRTALWALGILLYITVSSVILPLAILPAKRHEAWMTVVIVGLFGMGLAALLFYILAESLAVMRPVRSVIDDGEQTLG